MMTPPPKSDNTRAKARAVRILLIPTACAMLAILIGFLVPTLVMVWGVPFVPLVFLAVACALAIYATRKMGDDISSRLLWGTVVAGLAPLSTTLFLFVSQGKIFHASYVILSIIFFALAGGVLAVLASHFQASEQD